MTKNPPLRPCSPTEWERLDYERERRGEPPLGPLGTGSSWKASAEPLADDGPLSPPPLKDILAFLPKTEKPADHVVGEHLSLAAYYVSLGMFAATGEDVQEQPAEPSAK